MATKHDKDPGHKHYKYEREDARFSAVLATGLILFAAAVMTALGMLAYWRYSEATLIREDKPISELAKDDKKPLPPSPRLQFSPKKDMDAMKVREQAYLTSYGWVSREAGAVHIPIETAIDQMVERGLPSRTDADAAQFEDRGTSYPMESSSGRTWARIYP